MKKTKLFEYQKKASLGGICEMCKKERSYLTVDHIIPIALLEPFDSTGELKYSWEDNFQLLCHPCNRFKASRIDPNNPKTKSLLTYLLTLI